MPELTKRYIVMTMATEAPFDLEDTDASFVLKPWKDPAALHALMAYRDRCYPELGRDLDAWIRAIGAGPVVRGDVGRRNEAHAKSAIPASSHDAGRRARAAARTKPRAAARAKTRPARRSKRRR
jgi:hypothetical protein